MRDVSRKHDTLRTARAEAVLRVSESSIKAIREGAVPKGDPFAVAKVAAIQAVKFTPTLVPYCHTVPIDHVQADFSIEGQEIKCLVSVTTVYHTGVEIEAMAGAMAAALNVYDVLKMIDEDMEVLSVRLLEKTGGKSAVTSPSGWTFGVLVVSDRAVTDPDYDKTGPLLEQRVSGMGGTCRSRSVVPDGVAEIQAEVAKAAAANVDFLFVTGGTGVSARDVTPEAVEPLFDRRLPGIESRLRLYGDRRHPMAMLSRLCAGMVGPTVVVALPGSLGAVNDAVDCLFPYLLHMIDVRNGCGH